MRKRIAAFIRLCLTIIIIGIITLGLFECCYRLYIIDFYSFAWKGLNTASDISKKNADLLVFGDSFTANDNGYISCLRKIYPDKTIVNASCSGIGIKQVNLFASRRIKQTTPKVILYQVYVGNDLIDIKNLANWKKLSIFRNIYWKVSDHVRSLAYLNQRSGAFRKHETVATLHLDKHFERDCYDKRTKLYLEADPGYLFRSVCLQDDFLLRYLSWKDELTGFLENISQQTKVFIVFIPHCAQVSDFYYNNMTALGAAFPDKNKFMAGQYTFFEYAMNDFKDHNNVIFLNPLPFFREKDRADHRLYYENDPHFSEYGNTEFANYLKPLLFTD